MMVRLTAYVLAFLLLACTVAAVSGAVYKEPSAALSAAETETPTEKKTMEETAAPTEVRRQARLPEIDEHSGEEGYVPRMSAPAAGNPCYYSEDNIFYAADYGMPNCTCYAWGRAYEITGEKPILSPYDACTWYPYNAENGIYEYGDTPEQGAIACWAYADGGSGHVAVVEGVEGDTVLLSNSAYEGTEFYMDTVPADDPSQGRDGWIFQGYIYVNDN